MAVKCNFSLYKPIHGVGKSISKLSWSKNCS